MLNPAGRGDGACDTWSGCLNQKMSIYDLMFLRFH